MISEEDELRSLASREKSCPVVWRYSSGSFCFSCERQGEQAVAGLGIVFKCPLGSAQTPHFTNITDTL